VPRISRARLTREGPLTGLPIRLASRTVSLRLRGSKALHLAPDPRSLVRVTRRALPLLSRRGPSSPVVSRFRGPRAASGGHYPGRTPQRSTHHPTSFWLGPSSTRFHAGFAAHLSAGHIGAATACFLPGAPRRRFQIPRSTPGFRLRLTRLPGFQTSAGPWQAPSTSGPSS